MKNFIILTLTMLLSVYSFGQIPEKIEKARQLIQQDEIEKAKFYSEKYHLYLVPVIQYKKFDLDSLVVIRNPYEKIFLDENNWPKFVEQYSIIKK